MAFPSIDIDTIFVTSLSISVVLILLTGVSSLLEVKPLFQYVNSHDANVKLINLINLVYRLKSLLVKEKQVCKIKSMYVYPIKSLGKGVKVDEWEVSEFGLKYDRQYVLASFKEKDQSWSIITLRERASLINVEYEIEGNDFVVKYGQGESFKLPMEIADSYLEKYSSGEATVQLWSVPVKSHNLKKVLPQKFIDTFDLPQDTSIFYTPAGHPVRTALPKNLPNTVDGSQFRHATFQDYYPLLILSTSDLDNLNRILVENGKPEFQVGEHNFRPNIVVEGARMEPHSEDSWYRFVINTREDGAKHYFTTTTKCGRCMVPNINYGKNQEMDKSQPVSKALSKYRRVDVGNKYLAYFGVYAVQHETGYKLSQGDTFDVLQRRVSIFESPS